MVPAYYVYCRTQLKNEQLRICIYNQLTQHLAEPFLSFNLYFLMFMPFPESLAMHVQLVVVVYVNLTLAASARGRF